MNADAIQATAWLLNEHRVSWDAEGVGSCRNCGLLAGALESWEHQARILAGAADTSACGAATREAIEVLCGVAVNLDGPCNRVRDHQGPHFNTPIPMGMTPREWDTFVRSYR